MARALTLAERGWGRVHPNPLVGAVVVREGIVVAEGWHPEYGEGHAEAIALSAAGDAACGATLFVTLEPCTHHGKQPPCVEAIRAAGVERVVVALPDPNPVATGGIETLRGAGIAVDVGLGGVESARLNARFLQRFTRPERPFIAVKLAVSLDGRIADAMGQSQWISGPDARAFVHHLRAGFAAVGIGGKSLVADNAQLTVRGDVTPRTPPVRVVFDRTGTVPLGQGIFGDVADVPVWMVLGADASSDVTAGFESLGAKVIVAGGLTEAMSELAALGIDSILIEGGGRLAGAMLVAGLVDRVYQVQSPVWLGEGRKAWSGLGSPSILEAIRWHTVDRRAFGDDTLLVLEP